MGLQSSHVFGALSAGLFVSLLLGACGESQSGPTPHRSVSNQSKKAARLTDKQYTAPSTVPTAQTFQQEPPTDANKSPASQLGHSGDSYVENLKDKALRSSEPSERIEALELTARMGDELQAVTIGTEALADPLPEVRVVALGLLENYVDSLPLSAISHIALNDVSPEVRKQALWLLALAGPSVDREPLEVARIDPNPDIRKFAHDLLQAMD